MDLRQEMLFEEVRISEQEARIERERQAWLEELARIYAEEDARRKAEDDARYEALMAEQMKHAIYMHDQGNLLKKQEQERVEYKKEVHENQQHKFKTNWTEFEAKAIEDSKKETIEVRNKT
jgi:hypothetical protein